MAGRGGSNTLLFVHVLSFKLWVASLTVEEGNVHDTAHSADDSNSTLKWNYTTNDGLDVRTTFTSLDRALILLSVKKTLTASKPVT